MANNTKHATAQPTQVLVLGLCRTGTQSLAEALELLNIGPIYHMKYVGKSGHAPSWVTAYEIKFEGRSDAGELDASFFDSIISDYAGVSDLPAASFATELMKAYPKAKVILTTRDVTKWMDSMRLSIIHIYKARLAATSPNTSPSEMQQLAQKYNKHHWDDDFEANGGSAFERHNEEVLRVAGELKRELLVFEVKNGWGPLCAFLGVDAPELVPFPRADDWAEYKKIAQQGAASGQ